MTDDVDDPIWFEQALEWKSRAEAAEANLAAYQRVVNAAREIHTCFDHADNCCADWCDRCVSGEQSRARLDAALAALKPEATAERHAGNEETAK